MEILITYTDSSLQKIAYQSEGCAGLDLRASGIWVMNLDGEHHECAKDRYVLRPQERILVKTGVKLAMPHGAFGLIKGRSGLAMKNGIECLGGVIDSDYRGEIGVILLNTSTRDLPIHKGDRIAQIVILPIIRAQLKEVPALPDSIRGEGGFGSSGKN